MKEFIRFDIQIDDGGIYDFFKESISSDNIQHEINNNIINNLTVKNNTEEFSNQTGTDYILVIDGSVDYKIHLSIPSKYIKNYKNVTRNVIYKPMDEYDRNADLNVNFIKINNINIIFELPLYFSYKKQNGWFKSELNWANIHDRSLNYYKTGTHSNYVFRFVNKLDSLIDDVLLMKFLNMTYPFENVLKHYSDILIEKFDNEVTEIESYW